MLSITFIFPLACPIWMFPPFKPRCGMFRGRTAPIVEGPCIPFVTKCCLEYLLSMAVKVLGETFSSDFSWAYNGDQWLGKYANVILKKHSQGSPRWHNKTSSIYAQIIYYSAMMKLIYCNYVPIFFNYNDSTLNLHILLEKCTFLHKHPLKIIEWNTYISWDFKLNITNVTQNGVNQENNLCLRNKGWPFHFKL